MTTVDWSDVVDLGVENYEEDLPAVEIVKDKKFHSYNFHRQKGRGHEKRHAANQRRIKFAAAQEKLKAEKPEDEKPEDEKLKAEKPEDEKPEAEKSNKRKRKTARVPENSKKRCLGITMGEQKSEMKFAVELAKKIETDDHVEHDLDGIWQEIDGEDWQEEHYKVPSALAQSYIIERDMKMFREDVPFYDVPLY